MSFSYFDPEAGTYVTKGTDAIPVTIAQGTACALLRRASCAAAAEAAPATSPDGLAADQTVPAHAIASLRPLVLQPWFIAVNAAMLAALAIGAESSADSAAPRQ